MRAATIAQIDTETVLRGFNRGYEGYFFPVTWSASGFERVVRAYRVRPDLSPVLVDADGEVCGFAFLALRAHRAWVGALGTAPPYRRQGLASRLLQIAIENAAANGASSIELEVLVQNTGAQALYHRAGFAIAQEVVGFLRTPDAHAQVPLEMRWSAATDLWPLLAREPRQSRVWQRERASLDGVDPLWALSRPLAPDVHAFYTYNESELRIADWSIEDIEDARALTFALAEGFPAHTLTLENEHSSPLTGRLPELGWHETRRQYRMVRELE